MKLLCILLRGGAARGAKKGRYKVDQAFKSPLSTDRRVQSSSIRVFVYNVDSSKTIMPKHCSSTFTIFSSLFNNQPNPKVNQSLIVENHAILRILRGSSPS